jgi:signal recognition particle receptor subunit beta
MVLTQDVGGCDKIRPLWRHYYQNTQAVVYVVDSNDRQRIQNPNPADRYGIYADSGLRLLLDEEELKDAIILIFANKQDLPNALKPSEVWELLRIPQLLEAEAAKGNQRRIHIIGSAAVTAEGLYEGLDWLTETLKQPKPLSPYAQKDQGKAQSLEGEAKQEAELSPEAREANRMEALLLEWMDRVDVPDEEFLQSLEDITLDVWDHYTHLRIAWLYLTLFGRRVGMEKIFSSIKTFIELSPRTKRSDTSRGTTFHETMTYFWSHMVHYATVATKNPLGTFKTFLFMNPQFANGGMFLHYYSKKRMLLDPEARNTVLLPDLHPLPSLLSNPNETSSGEAMKTPIHVRLQPRAPLDDREFIEAIRAQEYPGWGHDTLIRLIYILLTAESPSLTSERQTTTSSRPRRPIDEIFETIRVIEKENFHETLNYFWVQQVSYHLALLKKRSSHPCRDFDEFYRQPECQKLRNSLLSEKYFSRALVDSVEARESLRLPDLKQLPNVIH